ncbi:hypothetical protein ACS0TY_022048 [Phlomoides rotata]
MQGNEDDIGVQIAAEDFKLIWRTFAPAKVKVHVWRVLRERIPTKMNLFRRNVLSHGDDLKCVWCGDHNETVRHVLFECYFSFRVWMEVCKWMGVETVLHSSPSKILLQFSRLLGGIRGRTMGVCIWECVVWLLWKGRNVKLFRNEEITGESIIQELKARSWSWAVEREQWRSFCSFSEWNRSIRT